MNLPPRPKNGPSEEKLPARPEDPDATVPATRPPASSPEPVPFGTEWPPGFEIGQRYRVVRLIGKGGMGAVYQVHDRELEREVALKQIRPDLAASPSLLERFKREIQLSSEVTHKNVLRVYDLGEAAGVKYLTMQYVPGQDLAGILSREGRLPVPRATRIFRQICEGLAAAHEKKVLHRDLKPQNILLDESGTVYIADFGLAKAVDQSGITQTGAILGTPSYMSPEQVKGEALDVRSDIYALGIILYEMLTGAVPYAGGSTFEVMVQRLQRPPQPVAAVNPDVPPLLQKILDRCLEINRELRYGSLEEVLRDLDEGRIHTSLAYRMRRSRRQRTLILTLLLIILGAGGAYLYRKYNPPTVRSGPAAIQPMAVLGIVPFQNRTGKAALDWCGEGIARLVSDGLTQSRHIQVVSVYRMQLLQKANAEPAALAKAAVDGGIGYLVTGEILPGAGGLSLTARLSETREGRDLASRRIDGLDEGKLINASDQVSLAIRKGLGVPTTEGVDAFAADFASRNPQAYESYLGGLRALVDYNYPEAEKAFLEALKKAPDYTMARYRLAHVYAATGRTEESLKEIRQAIAESSRLPDREQRYVRAAEAYFSRRYDHAIKAYRELVETYPYEVEARQFLALALSDNGQPKESIEPLKFMAQLEPENHITWSMLGMAYLESRELNEAVTALRRYVELEPDSANAHHTLGDAYRAQGEFDLAAEEFNKALTLDPSFHFSSVSLGVLDVLRGRYREAEQRLDAIVKDTRIPARHRIDAALELAYLLRAQGRFNASAQPLQLMQKEIKEESIREALALSLQGLSSMEASAVQDAARLIDRAVQKSPGVATRYLFARGVLELRLRKIEAARKTATEILETAQTAGSPNPRAEKAAAYLRGLALLQDGKNEEAISELSRAVSLEGPEYAIYRLGLARAYLAAGRLPEALAAAKQAGGPLDPVEPKLELEIDRVRALLVEARVQAAMGRKPEAAAKALAFLRIWANADPESPDLADGRRLAQQD